MTPRNYGWPLYLYRIRGFYKVRWFYRKRVVTIAPSRPVEGGGDE